MHSRQPHAAGRPKHKNRFAGDQASALAKREPCRIEGQRHGRGFDIGHGLGDPIGMRRQCGGLLGITALFRRRQNPIANREFADVGSDADDASRRQLARGERPRRQELISSSDDEQINKIDADGVDVDQNLIWLWLRARDLLDRETFGCSEFMHNDCAHLIDPLIARRAG